MATQTSFRVAAVVLNRNGRDDLLACLASVRALAYPDLEVVVVDNGSSDGSPQAVRDAHPDVHLVCHGENAGVAGGRNLGLRFVEASLRDVAYLLFLDNDTTLEPGALAAMVAAAEADPTVGIVAPKAHRSAGGDVLASAGGMTFDPWTGAVRDVGAGEIDRGQRDRPASVQACPGFAFLVRRSVFARVGGFDEAFHPYGWEDVDFSLRAAQAGFGLVYAPEARVVHTGGKAGRGPDAERERAKARNLLRLEWRHASWPQWLCFAGLLPLRAVAMTARELRRGNRAFLPAALAGAWDAVRSRGRAT